MGHKTGSPPGNRGRGPPVHQAGRYVALAHADLSLGGGIRVARRADEIPVSNSPPISLLRFPSHPSARLPILRSMDYIPPLRSIPSHGTQYDAQNSISRAATKAWPTPLPPPPLPLLPTTTNNSSSMAGNHSRPSRRASRRYIRAEGQSRAAALP